MAGTVIADQLEAASTSTLVLKNGVSGTPPTVQDSAGTQIGTFCRAWVNFNGTGTVATRASFNVTSITDRGTGAYTVNFTTAMPDANYSALGTASRSGAETQLVVSISTAVAPTASAVAIQTYRSSDAGVEDSPNVNVSVFR